MTSATPLLRFTPRAVPHADLEAVFIKRHHLVDKAISSVHELADGGGVHHHLFIGPRGVGKTHLMSIIAHRLNADTTLANRVVVAWLDEDPWVVRDYASLIEHIADAASLAGVSDGQSLLGALAGRCLVMIAENLDDIFARIETEGQHALRGLIENSRSIMILGAAVARFEDMSEHDRPFFGSFEVEDLTEFSVDEAAELLRLVAERDGDSELAAFLESPHAKSRLKVVEALAGGHPRVWMLLAGCLSIEAIDELVPLFLRSLDDLTPYYQERLRSLAKGHLAIVMTLCGSGLMGALPVGDIARLSKVPEKSAPQLLDQLVEKGFVRFVRADGVPGTGDGRVRYYELREPLLRLSVQMKRTKGQLLGLVVQFLRTWHGVDLLSATRIPIEGTLARLYVEAAVRESDFLSSSELYDGTAAQLRERAKGMRLLLGASEVSAALAEAYADYEDGSFDAAIQRFETAISTLSPTAPHTLDARFNLAAVYLEVGRYHEAIATNLALIPDLESVLGPDHRDTLDARLTVAVANLHLGGREGEVAANLSLMSDYESVLGPEHPDTLRRRSYLALAYLQAGRYDDAIASSLALLPGYERALGPDHPDTLGVRLILADAYLDVGRYDEAISARLVHASDCERVLGPDDPGTLTARLDLALAYLRSDRYDDGIAASLALLPDYERVLGSDHPDTLTTRHNLAVAYLCFGRHDEGIAISVALLPDCERALGPSHPNTLNARNSLANALNQVDRHIEAAEVVEPASTADPVFAFTLFESLLLQGELSGASDAFRSGMKMPIAQPSNSVEFLFDKLAEQILRKDPRSIVPWLVREFEAVDALDELGAGLLRALPRFLSVAGSGRASEWALAWRHETADSPQMAIPVQVLTALTTWWETRQRKSLLSLPPELRDIAVPLAERAIELEQVAQTK
jgi:tetratricopeptide (TPR) repeat protein